MPRRHGGLRNEPPVVEWRAAQRHAYRDACRVSIRVLRALLDRRAPGAGRAVGPHRLVHLYVDHVLGELGVDALEGARAPLRRTVLVDDLRPDALSQVVLLFKPSGLLGTRLQRESI